MSLSAQLQARLLTGSPEDRLKAAEELLQMGPDAAPVAGSLVAACADPSEEIREAVTAALESIETPPITELPELTRLLSSSNLDVAYWAATLLGRLGSAAAPALDALAKSLASSPHLAVRERSAWALGAIGSEAAQALPVLQSLSRNEQSRLARLCSEAIEKIQQKTT